MPRAAAARRARRRCGARNRIQPRRQGSTRRRLACAAVARRVARATGAHSTGSVRLRKLSSLRPQPRQARALAAPCGAHWPGMLSHCARLTAAARWPRRAMRARARRTAASSARTRRCCRPARSALAYNRRCTLGPRPALAPPQWPPWRTAAAARRRRPAAWCRCPGADRRRRARRRTKLASPPRRRSWGRPACSRRSCSATPRRRSARQRSAAAPA